MAVGVRTQVGAIVVLVAVVGVGLQAVISTVGVVDRHAEQSRQDREAEAQRAAQGVGRLLDDAASQLVGRAGLVREHHVFPAVDAAALADVLDSLLTENFQQLVLCQDGRALWTRPAGSCLPDQQLGFDAGGAIVLSADMAWGRNTTLQGLLNPARLLDLLFLASPEGTRAALLAGEREVAASGPAGDQDLRTTAAVPGWPDLAVQRAVPSRAPRTCRGSWS